MNDTFLRACRGESTSFTPVWMMRQAGRYLPEYQAIRKNLSFLELCKNSELCVEATLQPVDILGVDAAILFSDILILMEQMGVPLEFHENHGPVFLHTIRDSKAVEKLRIPDPATQMDFVMETIRLLRRELQVPLIGFAGAPFTCATYLIEGGSSKIFWATKKLIFTKPGVYHALMEKITEATILYLKEQIRAGAQAVQLFDSWAGVLGPVDFAEYALPYVTQIIAALKADDFPEGKEVPVIYFANNGSTLLELSVSSGADVIGIDWRINIADAIARIGDCAIQGNLDPFALLLSKEKLRARVGKLLKDAAMAKGHIFNLGHGINQFTPPKQAKIMIDAVHELSQK
ncbi:uroporphyrinogen decarboxylase [Desulforhopalus vacuolatus]|uniref:uroporphyrinogen decarboxylase n=1 Tax=Desulforhopalus vacuolatus TaxID=40414 RepID=UPI0019643F47|nr:uroporphyrinogen decarboxylase [Desulforhopalus vacuolatus]MBM9518561.1 uroporphyrinogen decarboxylase [Desulforhopalus vacuolatus]